MSIIVRYRNNLWRFSVGSQTMPHLGSHDPDRDEARQSEIYISPGVHRLAIACALLLIVCIVIFLGATL